MRHRTACGKSLFPDPVGQVAYRTLAGSRKRPVPLQSRPMSDSNELSFADLQRHIRQMYYEKDAARGVEGTFMWLMEEVGELSSALRGNDEENLAEEFADVIAWLTTIANVAGVDLNAALVAKYGHGCPGCTRLVCECPDSEKP